MKMIRINEEEAKIVRYIFERYVDGAGGKVISRELQEQGYLSPRGKTDWKESTVLGIIKNEKYKGDLLLGKTFTVDPISKRRLENFGEEDKFYIEGHHEAIISSDIFEKAQEIRLRRAKGRNTVANKNGKREKYSRAYAFSSMLECGFCGSIHSRRTCHSSSKYSKVIWQCVNFIKNGKSSCPHCKGIEEKAIEKAFLESYKQICYNNEDITQDLLKTVKDELEDNTLDKDLKKVNNKLNQILKKEKELVNLKLDGVIDTQVYQEKYNEIQKSKVILIDEKNLLEITLKDELSVKNRLLEFRKTLENYELLEEFDRTVFESIVDKIIVGKIEDDGTYSPHKICIIYKTGKNDTQNTKIFKSERKNSKKNKLCSLSSNESEKLCSSDSENAC